MILKRKGEKVNHKKVFRIYKNLGMKVLKRGGRKRAIGVRMSKQKAKKLNQRWALDFVSDSLVCGRKIRLLTVIDEYSRKCLGVIVDTSLSGSRVARELDKIIKKMESLKQLSAIMARNLRGDTKLVKGKGN